MLLPEFKQYGYFVGIDPDVEKNGIAIVNRPKKEIVLYSSEAFFDTIAFIDRLKSLHEKQEIPNFIIIVEAGWMNDITNFHLSTGKQGQRIALSVGRNQQVGMLICEYCKKNNIPYHEAMPLRKGWMGKDGKITHKELEYFTNISNKSNQEERDAILLAWEYADLQIKIKC